ncbi:hypothetical protein I4U23_029496 [Adineta vaga]|nr:hypothetical protein I4U23_029496 [Adineta vaga]
MKSILIFILLFILTIMVPRTISSASQRSHLYRILRESPHTIVDSIMMPMANNEDASDSTDETNSNEEKRSIQIRKDWSSDERRSYIQRFKNRRPIEAFGAYKRDTDMMMMMPPRSRRINGGLWNSGLIG